MERLRNALSQTGADAYFSISPPDNQYLSGFLTDFSETSSGIIVTLRDGVFLTDSRYAEQAKNEVEGFVVEQITGDLLERCGEWLQSLNIRQVALDPASITIDALERLKKSYGGEVMYHRTLVKGLRERKSGAEVAAIREASRLAEGVFADLVPGIKESIAERELAAQFEYEFKKRGAQGPSFSTIALFGARSSLPHGNPGPSLLAAGDILLLDFGCRRNGYCSDLTRTQAFVTIPAGPFEEIYEIVLEAQLTALAAVKPGANCRDVDAAARAVIARHGYGDYFGHGVGHGVGIEIHESPRVNPRSDMMLEEGMVITIEPGIYLPGVGGVRIEDLVAVTSSGCDTLSNTPKEQKVFHA